MDRQTRHIFINGRVQGVGFRDALLEEALAKDVCGWVRNRRDGRVEAVLQGSPDAVASLVRWAREGPPLAHVTGLVESPAGGELLRDYSRFERLPTA